ncbi:hypothetical protein [Kitasatospora sp. P5_F3]
MNLVDTILDNIKRLRTGGERNAERIADAEAALDLAIELENAHRTIELHETLVHAHDAA